MSTVETRAKSKKGHARKIKYSHSPPLRYAQKNIKVFASLTIWGFAPIRKRRSFKIKRTALCSVWPGQRAIAETQIAGRMANVLRAKAGAPAHAAISGLQTALVYLLNIKSGNRLLRAPMFQAPTTHNPEHATAQTMYPLRGY